MFSRYVALFIVLATAAKGTFALRTFGSCTMLSTRMRCLARHATTTREDGDESEWLEVLRTHRKGGAPRKVLEEVQERLNNKVMSQSMLVKAFRTLERMNRDDLAMKLVRIWPEIATEYGVNFGSAFVLVNACCKRRDLQMAEEICRISGLRIDDNEVNYVPDKLDIDQATGLLVELIVGHQGNNDYGAALSLLVSMQQSGREWSLSEEDSRRIMKQFLKGTARSIVIRKALRSLLLMGGLKDREGLQLLTNMYALSIRFIKGAISMDTLPVVVNIDAASSSSSGSNTDDATAATGSRGGTEYVEVAFIGRSNVGKSSLINMMTNRKGLAYTSKTPGKTAEFNYFELRSRYNDLVDAFDGVTGAGNAIRGATVIGVHNNNVGSGDTFGGKYNAKKNDWNNNGPAGGVHVPTREDNSRSGKDAARKGKKPRGHADKRVTTRRKEAAALTVAEEEEKKKQALLSSLSQEAALDSDKRIFFVDLPGLGYAERTRALKEKWLALLGEYISGRSSLRVLLHLVDSRHGLLDSDKECLMLLETLPKHVIYVIVLTKVDKSKDHTVTAIIDKIRHEVDSRCASGGSGSGSSSGEGKEGRDKESEREVPIVCTSSEQGLGGARLWAIILDAINQQDGKEIMALSQRSTLT